LISIYNGAKDNVGSTIPVVEVLSGIKSGRWSEKVNAIRSLEDKEARDDVKKTLPAVTFSGSFTARRADSISSYTNLIVIDFDDIDAESIPKYVQALKEDKYSLCVFVSPSGKGIKVLVKIDSDKDHHLDAFYCLEKYYEAMYALSADKSGKDICRLCFVSYDPELHYNGKSEVFSVEYDETKRNKFYSDRSVVYGSYSVTNDDRVRYNVCKAWAEHYKPYEEGNRNNHIFTCLCNLNRCGVVADRATVLIAADRTDFPMQELKDIVEKVYKTKASEHNTISIVDFEREQQQGKGVLESVSVLDILDVMMSSNDDAGATTGYSSIDAVFGGSLAAGHLYAFVGREKSFKSTEAIRVAVVNAMTRGPVLYLNGEMSAPQIVELIIYQQLQIKRNEIKDNIQRIKEYFSENLKNLHIVSDTGFDPKVVINKTAEIRKSAGKNVALIIIDGITSMKSDKRDETHQLWDNSANAKEIAKRANEGEMAPVILLMHTDSACQPWNRDPRKFIRGKLGVTRNIDGSFSFSRFINEDSINQNDASDYDLRNDIFYLKVQDDRRTGLSDSFVMRFSTPLMAECTDDPPAMYEIQPKTNERQ